MSGRVNRMGRDLVLHAARHAGHSYVIIYWDGEADRAVDQLAAWVQRRDLPLTASQAGKIADAILTEQCKGI